MTDTLLVLLTLTVLVQLLVVVLLLLKSNTSATPNPRRRPSLVLVIVNNVARRIASHRTRGTAAVSFAQLAAEARQRQRVFDPAAFAAPPGWIPLPPAGNVRVIEHQRVPGAGRPRPGPMRSRAARLAW